MSFTPTKEQLEELGFVPVINDWEIEWWDYEKDRDLSYFPESEWQQTAYAYNYVDFYPKSLDDLQTLIRLLTPPWNS